MRFDAKRSLAASKTECNTADKKETAFQQGKWFLFSETKFEKYNRPNSWIKKKGGVTHEKQQVIAAYSEFADVKQYPKFQRGGNHNGYEKQVKTHSTPENHLVQDSLLAVAPRLDR